MIHDFLPFRMALNSYKFSNILRKKVKNRNFPMLWKNVVAVYRLFGNCNTEYREKDENHEIG